MKKNLLITLLLVTAMALSSCAQAIHAMGGYTPEEYGAQATQIAVQAGQIVEKDAQIAKDAASAGKQDTKIADLEKLVKQLATAKADLQANLKDYQALVCPNHTWDDTIHNTQVWVLSDGNADLASLENETKVHFFLTPWVPVGQNVDPKLGGWILTIDFYNGMALSSKEGCFILDPKKWPKIGE